jgi:Rieske Fe-S protein
MTAGHKGIGESETRGEQRPTRRGVLLGAGLAGLGGALAGCSTAAVPYAANEAGVAPGSGSAASATAMPSTGASSGGAMSGGGMAGGTGSAGLGSSGSGSTSMGSTGSKGAKARTHRTGTAATGKVLADASEIPVGGGRIFTADKVVVTQPVRGKYLAFSAVCTHVGCILDRVANGVIGCPCHGGEFKITTGAVVAGPPPTPLARKRIKIVSGQVVLLLPGLPVILAGWRCGFADAAGYRFAVLPGVLRGAGHGPGARRHAGQRDPRAA